MKFTSPYPYFGGKSSIADLVWDRFGNTPNYVEPFFGSGAVLLGRPHFTPQFNNIETVNDLSGFVVNFWRSVKADPEAVAYWADNPSFENDLHARHIWLVGRKESLQLQLEGDPEFHDPKIAGWWVWGMAQWIGSGFCSGKGRWTSVDGMMVMAEDGVGINRQVNYLQGNGQGVNKKRIHLGNTCMGVMRQKVHVGNGGMGISRKTVHDANGVEPGTGECGIYAWMEALQLRTKRVRVCCGDWARVIGNTPTVANGLTAVFLDPPYADTAKRGKDLYERDSFTVAHDVREWAIANGDNPQLRIALCGYEGEHVIPESWESVAWKTSGGYGSQSNSTGRDNANKERIWFSPHCLKPKAIQWQHGNLFDLVQAA